MTSELDLLTQSFTQYVVTPLNAFGVGGFVFDVEGETSVNLQAEITDHYLEDNTTVQDHISIKPKRITLKNYVGELVFRQDNSVAQNVQRAVQKLTELNAYLPQLSSAAQQALQVVKNARLTDLSLSSISLESVNKTLDYWGLVKNLSALNNRQQQAYTYFRSLWENKILVSVQTPFEFMTQMAIESVVALQSEESRYISDFTVTLKQIRKASVVNAIAAASLASNLATQATAPASTDYQGRSGQQAQGLFTVGNMPGLATDAPMNFPAQTPPGPSFYPSDPTKIDVSTLSNLSVFAVVKKAATP